MIITTVHFMILHMNKVVLMDGDGPTTCTSSSGPESSNIYDVVVVATSESGVVSASGGAAAFVISSTINSEISHTTSFKSPEVGMAASLEFPFTSAQWKELERQALVYKYMMASLPVPLDLLYPDIRSPSAPAASHCPLGSSLNLRFSGRGDFEPGRCRRTDGKKWRCSRDVAPDQKYCERHMHRGRPRSRKPVELPKKKTRHSHTQDLPSSPSTIVLPNSCSSTITITSDSPSPFRSPFHHNDATESPDELNQKAATFGSLGSVTSFKEPRGLEWLMGKESVSVASDQDWQHLIRQTKIELPSTSPVLNQNYNQETLNFNSYVDFWKDQEINNCPFFLNPNITPLEKPQENPGRSFIDAWSSDDHNANPYSKTNERVSLSSLSLSMGGSSIVDNEMGHIHMGAGVIDPDQNQEYGAKSLLSNWLPPASWTAPTPGGPLGEVLRPSKVAHAAAATTIETNSNSFPPGSTKGDPCSPSVNAMSSSSGVFLHSSSNPTFTNSGAKPEIGLLWLSQAKPASST